MATLREIASHIGAELIGDSDREITAVRPLESSGPQHLAYLDDDQRPPPPADTVRAGALIIGADRDHESYAERCALLRVPHAKLGWALAIAFLHPASDPPFDGISAAAHIDESARIGPGARIAPGVFVGPDVEIGARATLYPNVFIGAGCSVGDDATFHPQATVHSGGVIGDRVTLHAGAVIAGEGFGWAIGPAGAHKVPHRGRCILEDDVEVGANTTIDRGALDDTVIRRGTKLDNLIMIGHNCTVGPHAMFASQVGLAGSTHVGAGVQCAGQAGFGGHLTVGDGARIGAKSGVHGDVPAGATLLGAPAVDARDAARNFAALQRLPELRARVRELERSLAELERGASDAE